MTQGASARRKPIASDNGDLTQSNRFLDQVAIVVGGAHGIGKAIGSRLAHEGAHVVIADIDEAALESTASEITNTRGRIETCVCDATQQVDINKVVNRAIHAFGQIDILMYIAGICIPAPFIETDESLWDSTLNVNLKGAFLAARAVVPHMLERRFGRLIFMSSTNSQNGEELQAPYNASKAGIYLLAKTLARELGRFGITSNAVGPGFVRTRLTEPFLQNHEFMKKYETGNVIPIGRFAEPEEIAGPAAFLASSDAAYVNGVLLLVDGGLLA
jgi:NAD(P)-dependent dehydrogenase (short-subunit alcohol dehydrogenase family)